MIEKIHSLILTSVRKGPHKKKGLGRRENANPPPLPALCAWETLADTPCTTTPPHTAHATPPEFQRQRWGARCPVCHPSQGRAMGRRGAKERDERAKGGETYPRVPPPLPTTNTAPPIGCCHSLKIIKCGGWVPQMWPFYWWWWAVNVWGTRS